MSGLTWNRVFTQLIPLVALAGSMLVSWNDLSRKLVEAQEQARHNKEDIQELKDDLNRDIMGLNATIKANDVQMRRSIDEIRNLLYEDMRERSRRGDAGDAIRRN